MLKSIIGVTFSSSFYYCLAVCKLSWPCSFLGHSTDSWHYSRWI